MKAKDFDEVFESDADINQYFDVAAAPHPNQEFKRVNVDFPAWMVQSLNRAARRLGVTRQSVIKVWLAKKLEANRR